MKESPGMGAVEVMKEMGSRWSKMTAAEKQPYEELAKVDKERSGYPSSSFSFFFFKLILFIRYNQEMLKYKASKSEN